MTTALEGGERSVSRPGRSLCPGKTRYPLYRRLDGPQGLSGQVRKISPLSGIRPRTVQPVASRYTDWATRPTLHSKSLYICFSLQSRVVIQMFVFISRRTQLNICCIFGSFNTTTCFDCPDQPSLCRTWIHKKGKGVQPHDSAISFIHVLPDYGWSGQPKNVEVLNKPNI